MKVLMISTDRKIFEDGSAVRARMIEYGKLFDELHIVVFTKRNLNVKIQISKNVFAYPTNSLSRFLYIFDAIKIGASIIKNCKLKIENCVITTQDPFET